jgi:phosphoenolpyruvate synthase/pyruvate phosphate dikinase
MESHLNISGQNSWKRPFKVVMPPIYRPRHKVPPWHGVRNMDILLFNKWCEATKQLRCRLHHRSDTGFQNTIIINSSWGLGWTLCKGTVTPDENGWYSTLHKIKLESYLKKALWVKGVYDLCGGVKRYFSWKTTINNETPIERQNQFSLKDNEIVQLSQNAAMEKHYNKPMDIEWAKTDWITAVVHSTRNDLWRRQKQVREIYKLREKG